MSLRTKICAAIAVAAAVMVLAVEVGAQTSRSREGSIRVETDLVNVPATVLDESGKPVADLPESAFELYQDGVKQKIDRFETDTNRPLELAVMVDSSASALTELKFEREATARFVQLVVRPEDLLAVFQFSESVYQLSTFSSNILSLEQAAEKISPGGGTSLFDAIVLGSHALEKLPEGRRRVVILVTDAGETTSLSTFDEARQAAVASQALVYTILVRTVKNENGRYTGGEHALDTIIDSTGGAMYELNDFSQLSRLFAQISLELRTQYLLSYYPEPKGKPGSYCQIELRVPRENYTLHYRRGYIARKAVE